MPVAGTAATRSFRRATVGTEHCITVQAPHGLCPTTQSAHVERCYAEARATLGLPPDTAMFGHILLTPRIRIPFADAPQLSRF